MNEHPGGLGKALSDLVLANWILAREGVLDAWGHVSVRHPERPDRFLLSCSRSPELVSEDDIVEHGLDGEAVQRESRPLYYERFIHSTIYEADPAIQCVVHSHADEVIPFTITAEPLRPVHVAAPISATIPVWDIDARFGDETDHLVSDAARGRDLARTLGTANNAVLMRGHGFVATGPTIIDAVTTSVYMPRNARMLMDALRLGPVKPLSPGEVKARARVTADMAGPRRAWEYLARRARQGRDA